MGSFGLSANNITHGTSFSADLEPKSFSDESKAVIDFIADYYKNIEKYPVQSKVEPGYLSARLPDTAPHSPESLDDILKDVTDCILPGLTHWQSPNFFGYFQANASTAGFLGEMLCSGFNVVGFNWLASPVATELESIVMDWMGKMLKLPSSFLFSGTGGGVLHGSTCESLVCTLAAARDKALEKLGGGFDNITKLVVYASDQTHFALQKSAKLIGIPPANFRPLRTERK
ncbi:Tyrosine decarboxylase 1 [Citrus sinensis]|nr:Tyrosine decarboxylase 1 [Citrus sinensis]